MKPTPDWSSEAPESQATVTREEVGRVRVWPGTTIEVDLVVRTYVTTGAGRPGRTSTSTPPAVDVRRVRDGRTGKAGEAGAMTPARARELAALLVRAADEAEGVDGAPPGGGAAAR